MPGEVIQYRPKLRPRNVVDAAIAQGAPLPRTVMLENLQYWHTMATELSKSQNLEDRALSRIARANAQRAAESAAPYLHPKLSATMISGDEDAPIAIKHTHQNNRLASLTNEEAAQLLEKLERGQITISAIAQELLG